ncbi:hypothetical protein [Clostridium felsineum]|uniref:hypothetical protein n=1 Tax=Clostridium felsineum TaxID=36839 RepID=UPI0009D3C2D4|nr:hypothetical protein [Clostridium felsineum]URZ15816.1 hypothetical protein CLFE_018630 [Clostridium felsineum DSM 794]
MNDMIIFVEGPDDERFYKWYFKNKVKIIPYATEKKEKINNYIKSIKKIDYMDYIFTCDIDSVNLSEKKKLILKTFSNCDEDKIIVSIAEIESWYLAGLNKENSKKMKIKYFSNTDNITKEKFNNIIPKKYSSRLSFMIEILENFDLEEGVRKNKTLYYFHDFIRKLAV